MGKKSSRGEEHKQCRERKKERKKKNNNTCMSCTEPSFNRDENYWRSFFFFSQWRNLLSPSLSALLLSAHASPLLTNSVLLLNSPLLHVSLFFFTFGNLSLMPLPSLLSSIFSNFSCLLSSSPLLDLFSHTLLSLFPLLIHSSSFCV